MEQEKIAIIESTKSLLSEPETHTRLRLPYGSEQLSRLVGEIVSLAGGDASPLMDGATSIKRDLSHQNFEVRRLLLEIEDSLKP